MRPLSSWSPRLTNARPDPSSRSRVVELTRTSPGPARAETRAAACTASPRACPPAMTTSPVCSPARISRSRSATARDHRPRALDGADRAIEQGQEAVAGRPDLSSAVSIQLRPHRLVVLEQQAPPANIADLAQTGRGIDDVGEQDRGQNALVLVGNGPVDGRARELDRVEGLVPHDPGVVSRRDLEGVAGADLKCTAVVHDHVQRPGQDVADVAVQARGGLDGGRHVLRPAPAGLPGQAGDIRLIEVDDIDVPERKRPDNVRRRDGLALQTRHVRIIAPGRAAAMVGSANTANGV